MSWQAYTPQDLAELYEVYDFKHAAAILSKEFPEEFSELCSALRSFRLTIKDIIEAGGNESRIPKKFFSVIKTYGLA